jgi:hypothetical protein
LEAASSAVAIEKLLRSRQATDFDAERRSWIEQHEGIQAQSNRLASELARADEERLQLEQELWRVISSRWWRLGAALRACRQRLRT